MTNPDGPLTAAQLRRRAQRADRVRAQRQEDLAAALRRPLSTDVGKWIAPPGKPGGMVRKLWHRQQADEARAATARKRAREDKKLRVMLAAHRVQKNAAAAKQRRIAAVIANPSRENIEAVAAAKAGRKPRTPGKASRAAAAGRPRDAGMTDLNGLMRSHGLRDESDVYNHLIDRGMSQAEIERRYPSLFRDDGPGAGARPRSR